MVALNDSIADDLSGPGLSCWPRSCKEVGELLWMPPAGLEVGHTAPSHATWMHIAGTEGVVGPKPRDAFLQHL